jgi:flavodoxin
MSSRRLQILYATVSGNAEDVARAAAAPLAAAGW